MFKLGKILSKIIIFCTVKTNSVVFCQYANACWKQYLVTERGMLVLFFCSICKVIRVATFSYSPMLVGSYFKPL